MCDGARNSCDDCFDSTRFFRLLSAYRDADHSGRMRRSVVFRSDINTLNVRSTPRPGHSVHCDLNSVADTNADAILSGVHIMFLHMRGPNFDIRFRLAREAI
jgi:hypothetical protein